MAERRMFAKSVIDSDMFLDMPLSSQALYFHLAMRADDDGFINNVKRIMRMTGCGDDDMRILISKRFVIPFESGIAVVTHWKVHNYIAKDRYKPSTFPEKGLVMLRDGNIYELCSNNEQKCIQTVDTLDTECTQVVDVGKDRLGKDRLGKVSKDNICSSGRQISESYFEEIWKLYPRKEGRKRALESYKRSVKHGAEPETIKKGVLNYLKYINAKKIPDQYVKMGSSFFAQESWADEYNISCSNSEDYRNEVSITDVIDINKL